MSDPVEERGVGSQLYDITVLLDAGKECGLRKRRLHGVFFLLCMRRVFSRENAYVAGISVIHVDMLIEPFRGDIIVLVHRIGKIRIRCCPCGGTAASAHSLLLAISVEIPELLPDWRLDERAGAADHSDFGVNRMNRLLEALRALHEIDMLCLPLLIAGSDHGKSEGLRMSHLRA